MQAFLHWTTVTRYYTVCQRSWWDACNWYSMLSWSGWSTNVWPARHLLSDYLVDDCQLTANASGHWLHANTAKCAISRMYNNFGDWCFTAAGPCLRKTLPLCASDSLSSCWRHFCLACEMTAYKSAHLLTYLLNLLIILTRTLITMWNYA